MVITNFLVRKLDDTHGELATAKKMWANPEFIPSDEFWLATFEVESQKYQAGIRRGRRTDVAEDIPQIDVQLRVPEEAFDADSFIPESDVADITKAVGEEFVRGDYWK